MRDGLKRTAPAVVLLVVLAACGGGGDDDKQTAAVTVSTADAPDAGDARHVPDVTQGGVLDAAALTQRCADYAGFAGTVGLAMAAAMDPSAAAALEELKTKIKLDDAPEEIRDDFEVVMAYAAGLGEVLAGYDLKSGHPDPAAIAAMTRYAQSIDQAKMQEATLDISNWTAAHCTN